MKITKVEYRETMTFGNYQNATVGAVAEVEEDGDSNVVLGQIRSWVQAHLSDRKRAEDDEGELRYQKDVKDDELRRLEQRIDVMKEKWEQARAFLEKHGIPAGGYTDAPF